VNERCVPAWSSDDEHKRAALGSPAGLTSAPAIPYYSLTEAWRKAPAPKEKQMETQQRRRMVKICREQRCL